MKQTEAPNVAARAIACRRYVDRATAQLHGRRERVDLTAVEECAKAALRPFLSVQAPTRSDGQGVDAIVALLATASALARRRGSPADGIDELLSRALGVRLEWLQAA